MLDFTHDTNLWVAISFIIFALILWRFGRNAMTALLDQRIKQIRDDIETAENLRTEAQELLAQYQRKHRDAVKEAEKIVSNAKEHAEKIRQMAEKDLAESMARRERQLEDRLGRLQESAIAEIQHYAANLAIEATREIIAGQLDQKANENLISDSIKAIDRNLG